MGSPLNHWRTALFTAASLNSTLTIAKHSAPDARAFTGCRHWLPRNVPAEPVCHPYRWLWGAERRIISRGAARH